MYSLEDPSVEVCVTCLAKCFIHMVPKLVHPEKLHVEEKKHLP
jgi:hypothetical protein